MDSQGIATIIGAVSGFLLGMIAQMRRSRKQESLLISQNYQKLFDEMRGDINRVRDEQAQDRKDHAKERRMFNGRIQALQDELALTSRELHQKNVLVEKLRGQVEVLEARLKQQGGKA